MDSSASIEASVDRCQIAYEAPFRAAEMAHGLYAGFDANGLNCVRLDGKPFGPRGMVEAAVAALNAQPLGIVIRATIHGRRTA